jgi:hypothetical protein
VRIVAYDPFLNEGQDESDAFFTVSSGADEDLIAYWSFNEGSGDTAHDQSGYGCDGTVSGAAWVSGYSDDALEIKGSDWVHDITSSWDNPITTEFTLEGWLYWYGDDGGPVANLYVFDGRSAANRGVITFIRTNGRMCAQIGNTSIQHSFNSAASIPESVWTYTAFTFDYTSGQAAWYINGLVDSTYTVTDPYYDSSRTPAIGNNTWQPPEAPLNGVIDELKIYKRALSPVEIWGNYGGSPPPAVPGTSKWGIALLALLLIGTAILLARQRRVRNAA